MERELQPKTNNFKQTESVFGIVHFPEDVEGAGVVELRARRAAFTHCYCQVSLAHIHPAHVNFYFLKAAALDLYVEESHHDHVIWRTNDRS